MSINDFLEQDNMRLLWEVLIDEPLIKQLCNTELKINNLLQIFESNINDFYLKEVNNCKTLIELNKKYMLVIINFVIKITTPNTNKQPLNTNQIINPPQSAYKKIKIHPEEPSKQSITYEDIHNERMNFFEKELNKKQEEFTNAMSLPVPPVPNFSDKIDEPISEIELEIKKIQEQRNYDIEVINNTNKNTNLTMDTNWLKPQETSVKNEKLNATVDRHIYWEDEQKLNEKEIDLDTDTDIFSKFKKITSNITLAANNDIQNQSQYHPQSHSQSQNTHYQMQIDEIKRDMSKMNEKLDLILEKLKN